MRDYCCINGDEFMPSVFLFVPGINYLSSYIIWF